MLMLEIVRFQTRRRLKGTLGLTVAIGILVLFYIAMWPSMADMDLDQLFEGFPDIFLDMFGILELSTIEGFLAAELYQFIWTVLLGLYFAYAAAGVIAGAFERNALDLSLSLPVTRTRLLLEEFISSVIPAVVLNAIVGAMIVVSLVAMDEWIDLADLVLVHAMSIPYFMVCIGIGFVLSVVFNRADTAQRLAIGIVFALWAVDSVSQTVDQAWLGTLAPSRYYQPSEILVLGVVEWVDALVLLAMTAALLLAAIVLFRQKDLAA